MLDPGQGLEVPKGEQGVAEQGGRESRAPVPEVGWAGCTGHREKTLESLSPGKVGEAPD
jgi:hypothetical protein